MMTRHRFSILLFLVVSLPLIFSCDEAPPIKKDPKKLETNLKSEQILEADKAFGFELFREVLANSDEPNIMISPLSVSYALGMTYNGSEGTTKEAFRNVLHFGELTEQEINESYQDLMNQLVQLDDGVEFSLANSIWFKLGYQVLSEFIETNRDYFDAQVEEVDFSDPQTLDLINDWIEDKTNGKIRDMLDFIPSDVVMYLINAIYFKAEWIYEFDQSKTKEGDFYLSEGNIHRADFMNLSADLLYASNDDFTAVELPYGDSAFSMVVMLPKEGSGVSQIVEKMDPDQWDRWFENQYVTKVNVQLPKFTYEFKDLLNDPLKNLGLEVAFGSGADFSRIHPTAPLYISRVIHQTFIDVNEEGTEAAAATIVEMRELSINELFFTADHPFLYVIKENSTGAIIFMGKVGKPEYS